MPCARVVGIHEAAEQFGHSPFAALLLVGAYLFVLGNAKALHPARLAARNLVIFSRRLGSFL
jgi:hypothetical protein